MTAPQPPPRSARERVAQRRARRGIPPPRRPLSKGCIGGLILLLLIGVGALLLAGRARQTLQAIEQRDPRRSQQGAPRSTTPGNAATPAAAPLPATPQDPFTI